MHRNNIIKNKNTNNTLYSTEIRKFFCHILLTEIDHVFICIFSHRPAVPLNLDAGDRCIRCLLVLRPYTPKIF